MTDPEREEPLTVGARLRLAREEKGLSLHQVADVLRLKASQVYALEEGDYDSLPGQTFVTGFLRSYANLLNLDAVAIVDVYKNEEGGGLHAPSLAFPEPTTGGRMPGAGILLGTFVFALVLLAGWFLYQESESLDFERVAELPEHLASKILPTDDNGAGNQPITAGNPEPTPPKNIAEITPATPTAPSSAEATAGQAATGQAVADESGTSAEPSNSAPSAVADSQESNSDIADKTPASEVEESTPSATSQSTAPAASDEAATSSDVAENAPADPAAETAPNSAAPADQAAPAGATANYPQDTLNRAETERQLADENQGNPMSRTFGVENTDSRVVLRATEESWVEVKVGDQRPVLSRLLKPGDVYMVPNNPTLKMTTGNAGGLEILVDGREIRSLGGTGKIVREVSLAADSLIQNIGLQ
ncbi:RodZ domain-containing protein [Sneathiella sp.]|jgi:cytoskeletal protein RodZ|uniref:RodZ domain-containing protein n=1 Tax=Sneathiella sp. TaxID=1964365 RepID=UPI0025E604B0|nr:RodZ domain-containing protein [Sneathiella sp.]